MSSDQFPEILSAIEQDISKEAILVIKGTKTAPKTWPCFIFADQGFWMLSSSTFTTSL